MVLAPAAWAGCPVENCRIQLRTLWRPYNTTVPAPGMGDLHRGVDMYKRTGQRLGAALGLMMLAAAPAAAQVIETGQVDRLPGPGGVTVGAANADGMRIMRPGALMFASFDRNFDGKITLEEIDVGTAGAFAAADKNSDGVISGFEQSDWASAVGSSSDVLANPMTFDTDLDRSITPAEFAAGLRRLAEPLMNSSGHIAFADLVQPLRAPRQEQVGREGGARVSPGG